MADLIAEFAKMTADQWAGDIACIAIMRATWIGVREGLFKSEARAERDRRELAELKQQRRLRERGLIR